MCTCMGMSAYRTGGVIIGTNCIWIVFLGAIASSSDTLMRLIYQKYKNTERGLADKGLLEIEGDGRNNYKKVESLKVRIEGELSVGGILPFLILLATIFRALDLMVMYCFAYYFLSFVLILFLYIHKAQKKARECESKTSVEK